jgi:hypothetical protein
MQLSFDIDGSLPEVAAASAVAGDESGQNRDLAPPTGLEPPATIRLTVDFSLFQQYLTAS